MHAPDDRKLVSIDDARDALWLALRDHNLATDENRRLIQRVGWLAVGIAALTLAVTISVLVMLAGRIDHLSERLDVETTRSIDQDMHVWEEVRELRTLVRSNLLAD